MFMRNFKIVFGLVLLAFFSCKEKLELNAPYKEIPSVYAVLDVSSNTHIIRVNKVFLGEGDANQMAQVADSINYPEGELSVSMRHSGGKTYQFKDSVLQTEPGAFNSTQRVYVNHETLLTTGTYTLSIENLRTKNKFTSVSKALSKPNVLGYNPFVAPYYPTPAGSPPNNPDYYIDYSGKTTKYSVKFSPNLNDAQGPKIYNLLMRLHYYDSLGTGSKNNEYIDYPFNNLYLKDVVTIGGIKFINYEFKGQDIFSAVGSTMSKRTDPNFFMGRKMYKIQYLVYASTQDYLDYLEYSKPSFSINQTKPIYSNFSENKAIGIFTFRYSTSIEKSISSSYISTFAKNENTCQYNFYESDLDLPGCP
jgi:hypothetical protein